MTSLKHSAQRIIALLVLVCLCMAPLCSVTTVSAETTNTNISIDKGEDVLKLAKKAGLEGTKIKMMLWWNAGKDDKAEAETFKEETGIEVSYETIAMSQYQT